MGPENGIPKMWKSPLGLRLINMLLLDLVMRLSVAMCDVKNLLSSELNIYKFTNFLFFSSLRFPPSPHSMLMFAHRHFYPSFNGCESTVQSSLNSAFGCRTNERSTIRRCGTWKPSTWKLPFSIFLFYFHSGMFLGTLFVVDEIKIRFIHFCRLEIEICHLTL